MKYVGIEYYHEYTKNLKLLLTKLKLEEGKMEILKASIIIEKIKDKYAFNDEELEALDTAIFNLKFKSSESRAIGTWKPKFENDNYAGHFCSICGAKGDKSHSYCHCCGSKMKVEEAFNVGDEVRVKSPRGVVIGVITDIFKIKDISKEWLRVVSYDGESRLASLPEDKVAKTGRSFPKLIEEIHKIGCV